MRIFWIIAVSVSIVNSAHADAIASRDAKIMFAAFRCAQYASLSERSVEFDRLFQVGYDAGKKFLTAVDRGLISQEDWRSNVPIVIRLLFRGPSHDFVIGRIYENATNDAFNNVSKMDPMGMPLPIANWVMDPELQSIIAETKFFKENCSIIK